MRVPILFVLGFAALPAHAQVYGPPDGGRVRLPKVDSRGPTPETWRDVADARGQIRDGRREGSLSKRVARGLNKENGMIGTLAARYAEDGTSDAEQRELDARAAVMRDMVAAARARGRK